MLRWLLTSALLLAVPAADAAAADLAGTLQQIGQTGRIRIGYREGQPPMSSVGKDGVPVGYAIDVCREVVAEVRKVLGRDVAVEYVAVTAENRFTALPDNVIDLLCAATTRTIARGEQVDFTLPTFVSGGSFMTLAGSDIRNNFGGKKIGVVKNTTTVAELRRLLADAKVDAQVVELDATSQGVSALEKREIDAFAADQVVLIGLALAAQGPPGFTVLPDVFSFEPFALAVRRNDADFRLVADRVLARLCRSRDIQKIYDAWFGSFAPRRSPAFDALVHFNAIPE